MQKARIRPDRPIYPSPAALITSADREGKFNIITLGEVFNISIRRPVIIGIAVRPATYSHGLILEGGEFVVNLPTSRMVNQVDSCGHVSGRTGIDKFRAFGLTPLPADEVRPPLIAECPVNIECKVIGTHSIGDHDLFLGEVVAVHVDSSTIDATGKIITSGLDPLVYMTEEYWSVGHRLGVTGCSREPTGERTVD